MSAVTARLSFSPDLLKSLSTLRPGTGGGRGMGRRGEGEGERREKGAPKARAEAKQMHGMLKKIF